VVNALTLKHAKEALGGGVVAAMPHRTPNAHQAVASKVSLAVSAGELTA